MESIYQRYDQTVESAMLEEISLDVPWALIERFSTLVRESGSEDERIAAQYISDQLRRFGVPHQVYEPELYLSVPKSASVEIEEGPSFRAKTLSFSASTSEEGLGGEVIYIPSGFTGGRGVEALFEDIAAETEIDVSGKIVLTGGLGMCGVVAEFERRGAIGQIYVNPGELIHWNICTTIWGTPDLDSLCCKPNTPVIAINRIDGEKLIEAAQKQPLRLTIYTELREGWTRCPLIVAEIPGSVEPERFVLTHGHYDSWGVGVGDNATGNAALLELARIFWKYRNSIKRSIRIAWWPGHSTGRYAGSTWYADNFALELTERCIAQVNIDSPGCRWATEYYDISWMSEAEAFCRRAIKDATGKECSGRRPHQAGDYSFNNIGITSFFMLLSRMPKEMVEEKGYYAVGGCGGNIGWHTELDTLEIADKDNLGRDLGVYVTAISRVANSTVYPFDFTKVAEEFIETLGQYQELAGDESDFSPALAESQALRNDLVGFYHKAQEVTTLPLERPEVRKVNDTILALARILIPLNFTRGGRYRTEVAVRISPLPDLAPVSRLAGLPRESDQAKFVITHLVRGQNRVIDALKKGRAAVAWAAS